MKPCIEMEMLQPAPQMAADRVKLAVDHVKLAVDHVKLAAAHLPLDEVCSGVELLQKQHFLVFVELLAPV